MKTANFLTCILCVYLNIAKGNSQDSPPGAIANEMCKIYTENAKKNGNCPIPLFTSVNLISRDKFAETGEFPHMVQVGYKGDNGTEWHVSGFIVSKNYVLTVAHGAEPEWRDPPEIVRAGVTDQADLSKAQTRTIESIIVHPEYKPLVKYNDIALFKVKEDFIFNKFVSPICLHTNEENPDIEGIHSGKSWYMVNV
uniref:Serine protease persephone-like n=1 Tax=Diabrotica virgifera virgifera TaxID=50390 RepID=A0A6P7GTE1_DIAVI